MPLQISAESNAAELYPGNNFKGFKSTKPLDKIDIARTALGEFGVKLDSLLNMTIACSSRRTKAVLMHTGCQEKRSDPGLAK